MSQGVVIADTTNNPNAISSIDDFPIDLVHGGTGATNASAARTSLGVVIGTDVQAWSSNLDSWSSVAVSSITTSIAEKATSGANSDITSLSGLITPLSISQGGTGQTVANEARSALGAAKSGLNSDITSLTGLTTPLDITQGGTGAGNAINARTNLGLGTLATQNSNAVSIGGGIIAGITDLAVADGGTGSSTASGARANLGAAGNGVNSDIIALTGLTTPLSIPQGGTGAFDASGARTNLGLGSIATQSSSNVNIAGGSISGITDLSIADGGTGASTPESARVNLGCIGLLATVGGINPRVTGVTNLYTVPAGKTAIITRVQYRLSAASGLTGNMQAGIGIALGEADIMAATNLIAFNDVTETYGFNTGGNYVAGSAGQIIKLGIDAAYTAGTGTLVVDLIGYLI